MNAKDWLDYGALGLAGLTMLLNLGLCKWVFGKAFEIMSEANQSYQKLAQLVSQEDNTHD